MPRAFQIRPLRSGAATLYIVLGDQLDRQSPILGRLDSGADAVLMMEVARESEHVPSHVQRTVLFLSAMRHHALWLRDQGVRVEYVRIDDPANTHAFGSELARAVERLGAERVVCVEPGEHRVRGEIEAAAVEAGIDLQILDDTHFLTTPSEFSAWAKGRKQLTMEYFYREQRRRLGMLVDEDGQPAGGSWNYDSDNRESFKKTPRPRPAIEFEPDAITHEVIQAVAERLPGLPGSADGFAWPVNREQAVEALDDFIEHRLGRFGPYEDAMWTEQRTLYHSRLSAAVNLHLLSPMECALRATEAYEAGMAPLNSVEGFVRQHIGWREFIRGVYFHEGATYGDRNGLDDDGTLPDFYWDADTDMACMADCTRSVIEDGYAHHIPRLMVMGNFAMLAGVSPQAVRDWYLGMYTDGVDWVTTPNVVGMSMHADGGVVGTKPYAASGKYISRMSNYCEHCRYDIKKRTGDDACPFNTLYWDFLIRHRERFRKNNRMAMMLKNVDRLSDPQRVEITLSARSLRDRFGVTRAGT
ncbi:MAG: cryptochrome/photolyase family protein [Planctomycetota bacterium]